MGLRRFFTAALFLALTVSVVNAYTVVMRDGRRVEIPNVFTVTKSTLTYGAGDGIQITIQLNTVDIAATERANGEPNGYLLQRAALAQVVPKPTQARSTARRSITNKDLEVYRQARVENDIDYEKRRQELGLPSAEERRREVAEIEDRTLEQVRNMRAQEEAYWRARADAMRAEMAANQAQMESLRQSSAEIPLSYSIGAFPAFSPFDNVGFGITGGPFGRFRQFPPSPFSGFLATPITPFPTFPFTPLFRSRFGIPGVRINPRPFHMRHGSHR